MSAPWQFDGDFDLLPLRAHVLFGWVPEYPLEEGFHNAVSVALREDDAAADWRLEAVRWRRMHSGKPLDLKAIAVATAARLYAKRDAS